MVMVMGSHVELAISFELDSITVVSTHNIFLNSWRMFLRKLKVITTQEFVHSSWVGQFSSAYFLDKDLEVQSSRILAGGAPKQFLLDSLLETVPTNR